MKKNKSLLVEDICRVTGRSRSLEVSYLNTLAREGLVEKVRDYIGGRERIRYKITEIGKRVIENLIMIQTM